ncbi:MAG TPA: gephyrin-like molybdotransferase Glp [Actinomycetota bacterium]
MKRTVTREELERPVVPYEEGLRTILAAFEPLPPAPAPLARACGLVLAEPVVAAIDVPGFASSAMDGYAVRSGDTPGTLRVVDDVPAGTEPRARVEPGTAARIMTGGPIPAGADAVVPWEDTVAGAGAVEVVVGARSGHHVRPRGEDVRAGSTVIDAGTQLRPVHLGVCASLGLREVPVHPRPRVAILSSGEEVIEAGRPLAGAQVYDANRTLLAAMCEAAGATVVAADLIGDDPGALRDWLTTQAARADAIVTTGGASVGEHDWMRAVLEEHGALELWRVAIKPGKPVMLGRIGRTPVLGLPGNPGSAFTGTHVFVQPAIRIMSGRSPEPASVRARLTAPVANRSRTLFCRVRLDGDRATPMPAQSSVVLSNLIDADGYAIVPPGGLDAGAEVTVELL